MGAMTLADNECLVALDDSGTGWIIAQSDAYRSTDVLPEVSAEDCGFNSGWDKDLSVGVYMVTLLPWASQSYEGEWDAGVDVLGVKPLWTVPKDLPSAAEPVSDPCPDCGKQLVSAAGGGVKCTPTCGYWFCF